MERKGSLYYSTKRDQHLQTVLSLHRSGVSLRCIAEKIGVSKSEIHRWISKFAGGTSSSEMKMNKKTDLEPKIKSINMDELSSLPQEEQIAKLKEALRCAELRADIYDEMINVAESKFNVGIRKKAGAKQ